MVEGKQRDDWQHTSNLMALLYNIHRGKNPKRKASYFYPRFGPKQKPPQGTIEDLKVMLPENHHAKR